ncbi:MAG: DNA damage-inducible protein D [Rickettsiales bacterium]|jgi:DNA-damage-inducible protein D|nr:DNA damage-inducible protein D [Rickettsiales bacterium]
MTENANNSVILLGEFDSHSHKYENLEYWFARDLQKLLGYEKWENFTKIIEKAKISCKNSGIDIDVHWLPEVRKSISGKGRELIIEDYKLTRYACYLIAQNGDPSKRQIAFAQTYFAVQTRKQEIIEQRMLEYERLAARVKLSATEKELGALSYERGVDSQGFAIIRSKGDQALFGGYNTSAMKQKLSVNNESRPLADFLPSVTIKAKDLAAEMTNYKLKNSGIYGTSYISNEHIRNNTSVRKALTDSNIYPEKLPPAEDIKKVERKIKKDEKQLATSDTKRIKGGTK